MTEKEKKLFDRFCNKFYSKFPSEFKVLEYSSKDETVLIEHSKCGRTFSRSTSSLFSRDVTMKCCCTKAQNRITKDEFKERCTKINNIPLEKYKGSRILEHRFRCSLCGEEFIEQAVKAMKTPHCKNYAKEFNEIIDKEYTILNVAKDIGSRDTMVTMRHNCGWEYKCSVENVRFGHYKCPICRSKRTISKEMYVEKVRRLSNDYEVIEFTEYKNKCKMKHLECGSIYEVQPRIFLRGNRCPICYYETRFKKLDSYKVPEGYQVLEYKNAMSPVRLKHLACGHEWESRTLSYFLNYTRCPLCHDSTCISIAEQQLKDYINALGYDVYKLNDRYELDLYIPELKIGFEYNGDYWHSSAIDHVYPTYHKNKTDYFLSQGIKLYHLWEHWGLDKCKSIISAKLGKYSKIIYARKCEIVNLDIDSTRDIMDRNHIENYTPGTTYGLLYEGEVVCALTIKHHYKHQFEIARFINEGNYKVIGGFTKLLKTFMKDYKPREIVTYLYRDICPLYYESVYYNNGFEFVHDAGPILRYWNNTTHVVTTRQKYQKHKLKELFPDSYSDDKTEKQILAENNIYQLHDSGNFKFIWRKD